MEDIIGEEIVGIFGMGDNERDIIKIGGEGSTLRCHLNLDDLAEEIGITLPAEDF